MPIWGKFTAKITETIIHARLSFTVTGAATYPFASGRHHADP